MSKTKSKRRGGWPERERVTIALRLEPSLADWLTMAAAKTTQSRSQLMEGWLASLRKVMLESEKWKEQGLSPFSAVEVVGANLVGELVSHGFATDFIGDAWHEHLTTKKQQLDESKRGKRKGGQS